MSNLALPRGEARPDIVIRMLEAASDAACDELAWQDEVSGQAFRDKD